VAIYLTLKQPTKNKHMKRNTILALSALLIFAACTSGGTHEPAAVSAPDSSAATKTDTSASDKGIPTSGPGNTAAGTSNPAPNLTDTNAIGTNRNAGRDTSHVPKDTAHKMKH
jgi:hypothetical protein